MVEKNTNKFESEVMEYHISILFSNTYLCI